MMMGVKLTMTNSTKWLIGISALFFIGMLLLANLYIQSRSTNFSSALQSYQARKEDLTAKQAQIQSMITDLNATLQTQIQKQNALAAQVNSLSGQAQLATASQTSASSSQIAAPASSAPAPVTRTTTRVTRAS
jgi:hypothetical protein